MDQLQEYRKKGRELLETEKYSEALAFFEKYLELSPDDSHAVYWKGDALRELGRFSEALETYQKVIQLDKSPGLVEIAWYARGLVLEQLGKFGEAIESWDRALAINPGRGLTWAKRGDALAKLERFDDALESYKKAVKVEPGKGLLFLFLGRFYVKQNKLKEALENFEKSSKLLKAEKDDDGAKIAESWLMDLRKRVEEQKTGKEPAIEEKIIREIRAKLSPGEDPLMRIHEREKSLDAYFGKPRTIAADINLLAVLRRWNSFTPKVPNRGSDKMGGGYFLVWGGKGVVVDPGFNFMENFDKAGFSIRDIDAVVLTHAHTDHTADLEAMLSLVYEFTDRVDKEYKVDLFMNLGTINKFIGWVSRLRGIGNIVSLNAGDSITPKGYPWTLHAKSAKHNELIGETAIGLVFEFGGKNGGTFKVGFTGDTGWSSAIQSQYRGCKLLILHLGSIGPNEFNGNLSLGSRKRMYDKHLGMIGVIRMIRALQPSLSVVSEFGEELGDDRCFIARSIDKVFGSDKRCLTGDTGLRIRLPDLSVYCDVCKNYASCVDIKEMTVASGQEIVYYCSSHTPEEIVNRGL